MAETPEILRIARNLDRVLWALIAAITCVVVIAITSYGFSPEWASFGPALAACVLLTSAAWYYREKRSEQRLASALECTAQLTAFTAIGAPLSYIAAAIGGAFPPNDPLFAAIDQALGLDWRGLLAWMNAHPLAHAILAASYMSFTLQAAATVLLLAFFGHLVRLRIFLLALAGSALTCIAISAILPAEGIWSYLALKSSDYPSILPVTRETHIPIMQGLRDGSYRTLTAMNSEGIIVCPSFHAALAVIFAIALWPVPVLGWIALITNILMVIATPIDGGHYFIDIPAGITVAVATYYVANRLAARWRNPAASTADSEVTLRPAAL